MKKLLYIMGGVFLLSSGAAWADISCTANPTCASLGYTVAVGECGGDYLTCPFDTSWVACIQCPEQCTELGYNKIATNGNYSCAEGQTVNKCPQNMQKYKCDGTACSYGYHLYGNLPPCEHEVCCDQRATTGNTSCYMRKNNTQYKSNTFEYVECLAAQYSFAADLPYVGSRTYNGGTYTDACGFSQYELKYYCMIRDTFSGNIGDCHWNDSICTYKEWYSNYDDSGYQEDCFDNPCYVHWQREQWGSQYHEYNGERMGFSEYCYKKYNIYTDCSMLKFKGQEIPLDFDYTG